MKCELCETHEQMFRYELNDKSFVMICELCGKVLWEFEINTKDRLLQLVEMLEYIKFNKGGNYEKSSIKRKIRSR